METALEGNDLGYHSHTSTGVGNYDVVLATLPLPKRTRGELLFTECWALRYANAQAPAGDSPIRIIQYSDTIIHGD